MPAVAVYNLPSLAHVGGPGPSSNTLPSTSTSLQVLPTSFPQIVPLQPSSALEHHLGSFIWERLLSRQKGMVTQVASVPNEAAAAAFLHIPINTKFDFMLELPMTSDAGETVKRALQLSFEALESILGRIVFEGARNSNRHVMGFAGESPSAVQVLPGGRGKCTITCFLDSAAGLCMLDRCY